MRYLLSFLFLFILFVSKASFIFIPMDNSQKNHLKAYGIAYWILQHETEVHWLLNYKGGSFMYKNTPQFENENIIRGVSYEVISDAQSAAILDEIASPDANMDAVKLEKPPKIAVYSPKTKLPWDDAVTMVLTYAEIPYTVVFDDEVLYGELPKYDWLHLHHEDFTGQYGKFYASYRYAPWYLKQQQEYEASAQKHGFEKVSELKLAVVKKIKDICETMFDGDPADPNAQNKLNFNNCFAFKNFTLVMNPYAYEYSNIDSRPNDVPPAVAEDKDYFNLFEFSAKWDPIPSMLTQNHESTIKGFMGQTTGFKKSLVKSEVVIMGENKQIGEARYIHGTYGKGTWTFYGGHDPEDYQHMVGEEPTDLNLHPNSPGFRLILNNILFPAAKKKKQKT